MGETTELLYDGLVSLGIRNKSVESIGELCGCPLGQIAEQGHGLLL